MTPEPSDPSDQSDQTRIRILEALTGGVLLKAGYNRQELTLAPHALFARHGELYVSALNMAKIWRSEDERRLGYFKVAGLSDVAVTDQPFDALPASSQALPQPEDALLFAVG